MGHRYSVVGTDGAHVVNDNCRRVVVCSVPDFLSVCAVPRSHQRHPGGAGGDRREPDARVARLSVLREGRHQDQTSGFPLGRVLAIATALGFLCPDLRSDGVQVGDVDKRRVPLLLLCNREVQAQQVDEAKRQQPRRESQTAASSDEGRCHDCAAGSGWMRSSGSPPHGEVRTTSRLFFFFTGGAGLNLHLASEPNTGPHGRGVLRVWELRAGGRHTPPPAGEEDAVCCCPP